MEQSISIIVQDGRQNVDARVLHMALEVGKDFSNWIKDRIKKYGFTEGVDYFRLEIDRGDSAIRAEPLDNSENLDPPDLASKKENQLCSPDLASKKENRGGHNRIDYLLSVGMAKELALAEDNEIGKKIRRELIEIEEAWNDPEQVIQRALRTEGLVRKSDVEKMVEELVNLARGAINAPFPGYDKIPVRCRVYPTKKGGRIYMLASDNRTSIEHLFAYDANGVWVGEGMCKRNREGNLIGTYFSDFVDRMEPKIGATVDVRMNIQNDDWLKWKAQLIADRILRNALPAPDGDGAPQVKAPDEPNTLRKPFVYEDDDDEEVNFDDESGKKSA